MSLADISSMKLSADQSMAVVSSCPNSPGIERSMTDTPTLLSKEILHFLYVLIKTYATNI